ncbi:MAG: hypothetical protein JXM70_01050, partial [Pirellulales bacterium]|nr:hypothetical protein [Pirellulales bacterium]
ENREKLDALAAALNPTKTKLEVERLEHLWLFNIIGDPMLRMRYPKPVAIDVPATAESGGDLHVSGTSPVAGRAIVELVVRRDGFAPHATKKGTGPISRDGPKGASQKLDQSPFSRRSSYPANPRDLSNFQNVYEKANDRRLDTMEINIPAGPFQTVLKIPETASGPCHVRVFVQGISNFALGSANLTIKK